MRWRDLPIVMLVALFWPSPKVNADDLWKITAYCSCDICITKKENRDGKFASGKKCYIGGVANNFLKFGTKIQIQGKTYTVEDRGSKKYFGTKWEKVKHIDIYFENHQEAKEFGVKYLPVTILKGGAQ